MLGKREEPEDAYDCVPRDPRDMVKATLPEPQPPAMQAYIPGSQRLLPGHPDRASVSSTLKPFAGWAVGNEPTQGGERGTYVAFARLLSRESGMAYGARALWSRSARSSRGSRVPPGRPGEPVTGRRGTGVRGRGRRRWARCHRPQLSRCLLSTGRRRIPESGVLRKAHAPFGGGLTEKAWATETSPAAYPTRCLVSSVPDTKPRRSRDGSAALQRLVDAHDERAGRRERRHEQPQQDPADRQARRGERTVAPTVRARGACRAGGYASSSLLLDWRRAYPTPALGPK